MALSGMLLLNAGLSIFDIGINLPDFIIGSVGATGVIQAISFSGVVISDAVGFQDGVESMGGNLGKAYICLYPNIDDWPTEVTSPVDTDDLSRLVGDYTLLAGKYFIEVDVSPGSSVDKNETQGEPGCQSFNNNGSFKIPGKNGKNMGFSRLIKSYRGIIIIPQADGTRIAYGTDYNPVTFTAAGDSGEGPSNFKGFVINWKQDDVSPGRLYYGTIPLSATETIAAIDS